MQIVDSVAEMQKMAVAARDEGKTIAFVPTMGFLHAGHASLLQEGRRRGDLLVLSIFVNPTQFGAGEDLDAYPRDMERDTRIAAEAGVDLIFAPRPSAIYPKGFQTYVNTEEISLPLCGGSRPGHFRGVTTVVTKLFNIVQPHLALFGKKDFQQLAVIRQMVADLNMPVEIIGMPIVRETDGLAMSSRNSYLSAAERTAALSLSRAIKVARNSYRLGERDATLLREQVVKSLVNEPLAAIDYVELRDGTTLAEVKVVNAETLLALAVKIGRTRLIDNCILGEEN